MCKINLLTNVKVLKQFKTLKPKINIYFNNQNIIKTMEVYWGKLVNIRQMNLMEDQLKLTSRQYLK